MVFNRVLTFRKVLGPLLFLIYDIMPQAVNSNLFLYVENLCVSSNMNTWKSKRSIGPN